MNTFDFVLIGGGIVGISTAWQLQKSFPEANILVVEKENGLARHQTGHNSGVIHAGVYYQPGSLKADFCKRGAAATYDFCREYSLPVDQCGKLLVATDAIELERLKALEKRCQENGIETIRWSSEKLHHEEPQITGLGALLVPSTGITDYTKITEKMAALFQEAGGKIQYGSPVTTLSEDNDRLLIGMGNQKIQTRYLISCGGLMADRITQMLGIDIDFRIIPFRGEYYRLPERHNSIVKHLIYPVPDPDLPFLGVHLTRMIDGSVTVGPNAVLGWKREGYGQVNFNFIDTMEMFSFEGFWKVMKANLKTGVLEFKDSLFTSGYLERIRKYCPSLEILDLRPYPAGIRAQAVLKDGSLVHDFLFAETSRSLHVCNAPSPAATSAIPIGEYLVAKVKKKFSLTVQ